MRTCIVTVLLLGWMMSCQQNEPVTIDWLYQRWRLIRTTYTNSGQSVDVPNKEWAIMEFRANGTIVYGTNGRYTACCSPNRFLRVGMTLDLVNVSSIPIPETDNPSSCAGYDCIALGDSWQILLITSQVLVIKTAYGINYYQPYQ